MPEKLIMPEKEYGIVHRAENTLFGYQGWGSVCRDENGTLYAVASGFRCEHICPFGKTVMYVSRNDGKTWTPPIVVNDTYLDDRDAGIVYLGGGRLLISWFVHPADVYLNEYYASIKNSATRLEAPAALGMLSMYPLLPEKFRGGGSYIRVSEDYGVTWGETVKLPVSAPHGPGVCSGGRLIYLGKEMYASGGLTGKSIAAYESVDGGKVWNKLSELKIPSGLSPDNFHEPHVIELKNGRLFGAIRAQGEGVYHGFSIYTTYSDDGGSSWSEWRSLNISGSPPHLLLHSSGKLICSFGRREAPVGERAVVSEDGGESFGAEYVLDDRSVDSDLGYPASVELDDGSILTVYYQKYPGDAKCSMLFTRWKL